MKYLKKKELKEVLEIEDLSDKSNGVHPINLILDEIKNELLSYNIPIKEIRKSPIVSSTQNYDRLYYPKEDVTRNSVYTRWIDNKTLLRTHTTAMVINELENLEDKDDQILLLPGLVYRRDVIDKTHVGEPHQLDIWRVSKNKLGRKDLLKLVDIVINSVLPNSKWRYTETNHHYTKDGIEVEVLVNNQWLEILECGEILPKLLDDCGLNSNIYSGLAMGIGLDRSVMLRKNIKDIRLLRTKNERIKKQMLNLDPYKEVAKWQPLKRDMSVCVPENWNDEIIGDDIRSTDIDIDLIEDIKIKKEWNYDELNEKVREKLNLERGYKNVLLTIILSSLDKKLTSEEGNEIYNKIYTYLNKSKNIYEI